MRNWTRNQKIGAVIAIAIVGLIAYIFWPAGDKVSKDDVKATCTAGGVGVGSIIGGWKASGRLKAAAAAAASLGFYKCSDILGNLIHVSDEAPIFTVTYVPPLEQGSRSSQLTTP
jgi:hypothetical protein